VLSEGRVVEQGNHKALLAQKGLYFEHVNLQVEGNRVSEALGNFKRKLGGMKLNLSKEKES
jgi:hypothetical protein